MSLVMLQSIYNLLRLLHGKKLFFSGEETVLHRRGDPRENITWRLAAGKDVFGHCVWIFLHGGNIRRFKCLLKYERKTFEHNGIRWSMP